MRRLISLITLAFLQGCNSMPEFYKTIDDIATDNAVSVSCDRDCFRKNTDLKIILELVHNE